MFPGVSRTEKTPLNLNPKTHRIGIILNGVTGRMGTNHAFHPLEPRDHATGRGAGQ